LSGKGIEEAERHGVSGSNWLLGNRLKSAAVRPTRL
jgi:hypothetical protein